MLTPKFVQVKKITNVTAYVNGYEKWVSDKFDVQTDKLKQEKSKKENERKKQEVLREVRKYQLANQCHLIPECSGRCENGYCEKTKYY